METIWMSYSTVFLANAIVRLAGTFPDPLKWNEETFKLDHRIEGIPKPDDFVRVAFGALEFLEAEKIIHIGSVERTKKGEVTSMSQVRFTSVGLMAARRKLIEGVDQPALSASIYTTLKHGVDIDLMQKQVEAFLFVVLRIRVEAGMS